MITFIRKYSIIISVLLVLVSLILMRLFPSTGFVAGISLLLFSFILAILMVVEKHRQAYLQGKISRTVCVRKIVVDTVGILLAILLASLLGKYVAGIATQQIGNDLTKFIAGILIGLLAGISVGILVRQIWGRVAKT